MCARRSGRACGCGASPTRTFDLLSSLQRRLLVVDGLAGQREDPDLRHLPQQLLVAAAERQDLAALRWVLHHLSGSEERLSRVRQQLRNSDYCVPVSVVTRGCFSIPAELAVPVCGQAGTDPGQGGNLNYGSFSPVHSGPHCSAFL